MWRLNWLFSISNASSHSNVQEELHRSHQTSLLWSDGSCPSEDMAHPPSLGQPGQTLLTWVLWCWILGATANSQLPEQWCSDVDKEMQPRLFSPGLQFSITSPCTAGRKELVSENSQEISFLFIRFFWWFNHVCPLWKVLNIQTCTVKNIKTSPDSASQKACCIPSGMYSLSRDTLFYCALLDYAPQMLHFRQGPTPAKKIRPTLCW